MSDMALTGFRLAPIKQEGMCFSRDYPEIKSWFGCRVEFDIYFKNKYSGFWYLKPLVWILRKIALDAWDNALFTNAKHNIKDQRKCGGYPFAWSNWMKEPW